MKLTRLPEMLKGFVAAECEACKKRRQKIKRVLKSTRDRLRRPRK